MERWRALRDAAELFLIETEYQLHMIEAQAEWIRGFLEEIEEGLTARASRGGRTVTDETGELPPEFR